MIPYVNFRAFLVR